MNKVSFFPHDFGARLDPKMINLQMQMGNEGIGIYWCLIEYIYEQGGEINKNELEQIAFSLHTEKEKILKIIENFNLFFEKNEKITSKSLTKRLKKIKEIKAKAKQSAERRWIKPEKTTNNKDEKNMRTQCERNANAIQSQSDSNAIKEIKGNKIKEIKEIKGNKIKEKKEREEKPFPACEAIFNNWNLFAREKGLATMLQLSETRKTKLLLRLKEPEFDFDKILNEIKQSDFLLGVNNHNWKVSFDFIIHSQQNYLKILEGNYKNDSKKFSNTDTARLKQFAGKYQRIESAITSAEGNSEGSGENGTDTTRENPGGDIITLAQQI